LIQDAPAAITLTKGLQGHTAIFGGTFDPVHNAHLAIAQAARDKFQLRKILFVPAASPPHKRGVEMAPFEDRVRMLELACAGMDRCEVSRIEQDAHPSYSILTIEQLLAADAGPLAFLIGADAFAEIRTWKRWQDVIRLVDFIVVTRPGSVYNAPDGSRVYELADLELPVSSSEVREEIARGSIDIPVPEAVRSYVRERGLYGSGAQ
jgi:nicotinate-nucleotide adenylyltransferase